MIYGLNLFYFKYNLKQNKVWNAECKIFFLNSAEMHITLKYIYKLS